MIGQTIAHYRVTAKLGAGGMGEVYRARDEKLEREVALKILPASNFSDPAARARLLREARAAASLNHPHICTIYEVGEAEGQAYIAMELVEGQPLSEFIQSEGLSREMVLRYGIQIADALGHAHDRQIVHRDLKSANVVITSDGRAKVLDFGLAKRLSGPQLTEATTQDHAGASHTEPGTVAGTLAYMAPEQLRGEPADARSDIWAMGVVLYEMAAGEQPFRGRTGYELSSRILSQPLPPLPSKIPIELRTVIERCLAKEPAQRYQRAGEARAALEALQTGTVVAGEGWGGHLPSRSRQFVRWGIWAGVAAAVILAGVMVLRFVNLGQPPEPLIIRPATSFVGMEWGVTWSPDGNFIAYGHNRYGHMDVFVLPTGGGDPIRLTDNPADELTARWSPDGRQIAFVSDRGTGMNVYLIPPLGGTERKLVETNIAWIGREAHALMCLGGQPWSPDGNELVFCRLHPSGETALWKVNLRTGAEIQLTKPAPGVIDNGASWSFDGKRIAFARQVGGGVSLWLIGADGGEPELLLDDTSAPQTPVWLPDNQRLLFPSTRGGTRSLWQIDIRTQQVRQVTTGSGNEFLPAVSPAGKIAYTSYGHQVDLYWTQLGDPDEKHQRLTAHTQNNFGARVSPDGEHVLYQSDRTGNYELWLLDRRSGTERQITDHPASDFMADWSPDGKQIVFLSGREGGLQPWVMEVESGRMRRISQRSHAESFEPHFSGPRWSPDGKAIGFVAAGEKEDTLFIVDPQGGNERSPLPGVNTFDWYRDNRHVVYTRRSADGSGVTEMRVADLETGKEALLLRGPTAEMVVSRDGHAIAFLHSVSHFGMQVTMMRLSAPSATDGLPRPVGNPQAITHGGGNWHVHNGGWSPDGKAIVYTRDNDSGDVFVIQNYR